MSQSVPPYELRHIDILDEDNYSTWKIKITFVLKKEKFGPLWMEAIPNQLLPPKHVLLLCLQPS